MSAGKRKMDLSFSLLYVCCFASILPANSLTDSKTVQDLLMENEKLSQMQKLATDAGLLSTLGQGTVTLFAPSNDAFNQSVPSVLSVVKSNRSKMISFIKYHMVLENLSSQNISSKMSIQSAATEIGSPKLYFSSIGIGGNKKYTINGAVIVTKDIIGSNGRIHIINDLLYPTGTTKTSYMYTLNPDLPNIAFQNSIPGFGTMPDIVQLANSTKEVFTVFSTNDTKLYKMSDYAVWPFFRVQGFLKEVTKGHMVRGSVNFLPKLKDLGSINAMNGTIKIIQSGKDTFVSNRGAQAKVLVANIPLANGVMHVIDDLLVYVYKTIMEELGSRKEFSALLQWVERVPSVKGLKTLLSGTTPITMFVPTTSVVQRVSESDRHTLWYSSDKLIKLLNSHMIIGRKLNSASITDGMKIVNSKGQTFKFYKQQNVLYVEVGYIRARIIRADVGCKNGLIHVIDQVLKLRPYNLHDLINHQPDLKLFATLIGQDRSIKNLLLQNGDKTVFVPSDAAMKDIGSTRLRQLGKNTEVLHQVLKSHIISRQFLDSEALAKIKRLNDSFGETLKVTSEGNVINVSLADGTVGARVIRKNLVAKNGMLHVIDKIIYRGPGDIYEYIQKDPTVSYFRNMAQTSKESRNLMRNSVQLTMFIPENSGFDEITKKKLQMLSNRTEELVKQHTILGERLEKQNMTAGMDARNMMNQKIYFGVDGTDTLVIGGYIRARITRTKRYLNGIIYTIDKLLYYVPFNLWELIQKHPMLNKFRDFVDGEYLRELFTTEANRFTVFAPSDNALKALDKIVKDTEAKLPPHVLKIIESHIIKGKMITSDLMKTTYKNPSLNGDIISLNKTTGRHVYVKLELQERRATVVERDVIASNGVIHVIDKLLVAQPKATTPTSKVTSAACSTIYCQLQTPIFMGIILHILHLTT